MVTYKFCQDCGPDEEMVDGKCLPECEHSQQIRDDYGACMPLCTDGKRARSDGRCVPACYPGVCGDQGQCQVIIHVHSFMIKTCASPFSSFLPSLQSSQEEKELST